MRAATAVLTGFFVIAGGVIPAPLARVHPPAMDVTKPEPPHYVLLRRKPEPSSRIVLNPAFFWDQNKNWEFRPRSAPSVYPPWSKWALPAGNKLITITAERQY